VASQPCSQYLLALLLLLLVSSRAAYCTLQFTGSTGSFLTPKAFAWSPVTVYSLGFFKQSYILNNNLNASLDNQNPYKLSYKKVYISSEIYFLNNAKIACMAAIGYRYTLSICKKVHVHLNYNIGADTFI
jgi:hypothetical protein